MDRGQSPLALSANAAQFLVLAGLPAVLLEAWLELTCSKLWVLAEVAFLRLRVAEYTSRIAFESVAPSSNWPLLLKVLGLLGFDIENMSSGPWSNSQPEHSLHLFHCSLHLAQGVAKKSQGIPNGIDFTLELRLSEKRAFD